MLAGSNDYGGGTDVQGGTLILASPAAIENGTSLAVGTDANSTFGTSAAGLQIAVSPVPEPSTLLLLIAFLWSPQKGLSR